MKKSVNILFIFMLITQSMFASVGFGQTVDAEGSQKEFNTNISYIDEDGEVVDPNEYEGTISVQVDWSVQNNDIKTGDQTTVALAIADKIDLDESQSGKLNFEGNDVANYHANTEGIVSVQFADGIEELKMELLEGTFTLAGEIGAEEVPDELEDTEESSAREEGIDSVQEEASSGDHRPKTTKRAIQANEEEKQGFNLELGKVIDLDGNEFTEESLLDPKEEFELKLDWNLDDGHNYKKGDTETFELPKGIKIKQETSGELRDEAGQLVATYTITPDKNVALTFTDFVETHSNIKGWLKIISTLDEEEVEVEDGEAILDPIGEEGEIKIPIDYEQKEKTIEKSGTPNKGYNADEINWKIIINKHKNSLTDAKVEDVLPEGTTYKAGSLKVIKLKVGLNGNVLGDVEEVDVTGETIVDGTLTIPLGDIKDAYRIEYVTTVTDDEEKQFRNKATLSDRNLDDVSAESTITINRGEAIKKKAAKSYNPKTGIIEWEIEFNYNEKNLTDVTLTDAWTPTGKLDLVEDSLVFTEVTIDENGAAHETENTGLPEGAILVPGEDGFEVTGITTNKSYKITYQTKVKDRVLDPLKVANTAGFGSDTVGSGTGVGTYYGSKSAGTIDYEAKTIDWKIEVNHDEYPMKEISITDTLGEGLTLLKDTIKITVDGEEYTESTLVEGNPFTIKFPDDFTTDKKIEVSYKTEFDANKVPDHRPTNKAGITWTPGDGGDSITKEVEAGTELNRETKDDHWKNGSYNPETKEITWTIYTNYRENDINNLIVTDAPQGNQKIVADSVKVSELEMNPNGGTTVGKVLSEAVTNVDEANNSLTVTIGKTNKAYKIEYRTSLADLSDIQKEYVNKAEVLDGTDKLDDLTAKVGIAKADTYGEKSGYQDGKQVHWSVKVNLGQQKIINLKLEDTISDNQEFLVDTFKVYHATVDVNGNALKGEEVPVDQYKLTHTAGEQTFTVEWNGTIERAFIVEYSTLFFEKHGQNVTNTYKVTGDSIVGENDDTSGEGSVTIKQLSSGGGSGEAGYLVIDKIGKKDGVEAPLAGAEFDLIDPETGKVLKSGRTDENGQIDFGRLLFGEYELYERVVPDGYVTKDERQTIEINKLYEKDANKEAFSYEVLNFEPVFAIELFKTDDENKALAGAEFALFDSDSEDAEALQTATTNNDGKILFEGLGSAGTYYVQETKAPAGYVPDGTKHKVTIGEKESDPIELTVENIPRGAVLLTKVDKDTEETLAGVQFELQKLNEKTNEYQKVETDKPLITHENGNVETPNTLEAGSYQFVEVKGLDGYRTNEGSVQFEVDVNNTNTQTFTMTNEKHKGSVKLIKSDAATKALLDGAEFKLLDSKGEIVKEHLVTNNQGEINIENLFLGKYQLIETKALAGYELDETPIDVEITKDLQVVEKKMTNHKITDISVEKQWNNAGGETTPVTVKLLPTDQTVELNDENNWRSTFNDLRVYDESGEEINYEIEELDVDGFTSTVTGDKEVGFIVTNTELTTVSGVKVWLDDLDEHAPITVELLANGTKVDEVKVNLASDWNYEFTHLEKYDELGEVITYSVDEIEVEGYETTINGFDITNLRIGETELSGEKIWLDDESEDRPEAITVQLLANGEVVDSNNVTVESNWKYEFTGLDKYDEQGKEITYTVDEKEVVDGYEKSIEDNNITNLRVGITEIEVTKLWKDEDESDRPDTITINLQQNDNFYEEYEVTKENDWNLSITDLPQYDEKGRAYTYTVTEHDVAGYESKVNGLEITNTRTDVKSIDITKTWLDDDSKDRPASIEVELFRSVTNGDKELVETSYTVEADNDWSLLIEGLPAFDSEGKAYTYEIAEKSVEGYETIVNGFDITNLRVGETEVEGRKVWLDSNTKDRPEEIIVQLFANGDETDKTVTVGAASDWTYQFKKLDKYDGQGKEIEYSVDEVAVEGYETTVNGFDITNVRIGTTSIDVEKTWENDEANDRPDFITVDLLQNDQVVETVKITNKDDWAYQFTNLAAYDDKGLEYNYSLEEHHVEGYESTIEETKLGYTITNTFIDEPEEPKGPSEPENPVDPKDPQEHGKPDIPKDKNEGSLPNTATNTFNTILVGALLLLIGSGFIVFRRRKA